MDIIIGAGITGLSYAMFASPGTTKIFEKSSTPGGYCRTTERNGFTWDYSGHFFHFKNEDIKNLVMCKMNPQNIRDVEKSTMIQFKDRLIDFPFQKNIHQLPKSDFIECLTGLFDTSDANDTTFLEMLYHKFGKGITDKFLRPYNEKLYACDLNTLDKDAMGRFFPYADRLEIIHNFAEQKNNSYNGRFLYPASGGAYEYVKAILSYIDCSSITLGTEVVSIAPENKIVFLNNGEEIHYDNLISTMPLPELLDKCGIDYDKNTFSWNQVLTFNLGFNKKGLNVKDHWIYFPDKNLAFYRVGFYNNIMGKEPLSLYVEIGFPKEAKINSNEWLGKVLDDLKTVNIIDETYRLVDFEAIIMNPAYVHISGRSIDEVKTLKEALRKHDIYSIGRYGSWTYCSIEDNIIEAKELASSLKK